MKLIGTHQLLVYTDDLNVFSASICTIKENKKASIFVSNEIGLELSDQKTAFVLAICLRSPSIYNCVPYILTLYVWHVNFCYGMSHCLCSGLVILIVIVQAQHINNRKYSNSYTINDKC